MTLFDPRTTALVMIDLQEANMTHDHLPHGSRGVLDKSLRLIAAAREAGSLLVHVRSSFLPNERDSLQPILIEKQRPANPVREPRWDELVPEVAPQPNEPVLVKRSWNAFHGSDLDVQLRRHGIETIVLIGMSTNWGVEGTARAAYENYYNIVFAEDAMSAATAEGHRHSVETILPLLGRVRSVDEVERAFGESAA
ncbi:isochorismatase family protein [Microbacterium sp. ASV81]|uniref:Isochorismatase family protein n=1 Tax=Microbacterium capsulatum TaxID=3041921 RepID=A0ABU0XJD7_9MICO|nr:isochorismatase family protein [Microbacterium sp. ASV81]MDQ4214972.1 isochorismatase family protein [Microbacterium sp. ASV81]